MKKYHTTVITQPIRTFKKKKEVGWVEVLYKIYYCHNNCSGYVAPTFYKDNRQVITVYCKVLLQHKAGGNDEKHQKSASDTIPIEHLLDASQKS
jgi:hypothetical protein